MEKNTFGNNALMYGLIIAIFNIVLTLVYYVLDIEMFSYSFIALNLTLGLAILIGVFVFGIKNYREKILDGRITFGQAFLQGLAIGAIGYGIIAIFTYVFHAFIAPEYMAGQMDSFIAFMEGMEVPDSILDEAVAEFEENLPPIKQLISAVKTGGIMTVIFSLIVAASVKKDTTQPKI
ncbi:MAG: DUF4199 domain-containing protein [Bacteroidales bacterium]|nr:DUF4199 domain-containing protein [Bacteroidales bacterium]